MNRIFPLPLYTFLKLTLQNGGISFSGLKNTPPWILKTVLFEPLRWIELALHNKKTSQHRIEMDPLFVLGYYRSGTSYLHQCLVQDDRIGYHTNFQMVLPEVMLTSEKALILKCKFFTPVNTHHHGHLSKKSKRKQSSENLR